MRLVKKMEGNVSMDINNNLESYVQMLTDDLELVDNLSEEAVDTLINYLENKIQKKERILNELKKSSEN